MILLLKPGKKIRRYRGHATEIVCLAFNPQGEKLIAWGEAISHSRGGRLNLRLFDAEGRVTGYELEEELHIVDFSFPAAAALPDGDFLVLH